MKIETARLILRDYQTEDWERVHIYGSQPEFSQYEAWGANTIEDTKKFIADMVAQTQSSPRFKFDVAICLKESGLLIGGGGIRREAQESQIANLGWAINPDFQNSDYLKKNESKKVICETPIVTKFKTGKHWLFPLTTNKF